jgi:uncharacterized repeat protein (TIGR02543 family)
MKKCLLAIFASFVLLACGGSGGGGNPGGNPGDGYTVTFNTNGGTAIPSESGVFSIENEYIPVRPGFIFAGWFINSNLSGNKITFPYTVTQDITLYAKWVVGNVISSAEDLKNISLSGNYILNANISLAGYNSGEGWDPIGSCNAPFTGIFDGNGYVIEGLYINRTGSDTDCVGLFAAIDHGGSIRNLSVEINSVSSRGMVGGIVGEMGRYGFGGQSTITNSHSYGGSITALGELPYSGGIVGSMKSGKITNSSSAGYVLSSDTHASSGGIAGEMDGGTIEGSHSTGNITANPIAPASSGGIVGDMSGGSIKDSYSEGIISGAYSGGIVGVIDGDGCTITKSYSKNNVSGSASGGIVGYAMGDSSNILNCYSEGNISSSGSGGGIVGNMSGDNSAIANSYNIGAISGSSSAGGIAGNMGGANNTIKNCYSKGNITTSVNIANSGGIAGNVTGGGTIENCYSTGNISSSSGNIANTGGIAGSVSNGNVKNCAAINHEIYSVAADNIGRIVGDISGAGSEVSNNYALGNMQDPGSAKFQAGEEGTNGKGGVSKTDGDFMEPSTFSFGLGWNFGDNDASPWKTPVVPGYPILYWQ